MPNRFQQKFMHYYQRHQALVSILVFAAGFLFDVFTIRRIDDLFNLLQHGIKLFVLGTLLVVEIRLSLGTLKLSNKGRALWRYHDIFVHFLFGSLLSAYTIFYFNSASAITSFIYILLLAGLMLANEVAKIRELGLPVRVILFSICTLSYFCFFYPILLGHVGVLPFWLGTLSSLAILGLVWRINFHRNNDTLKKHVLLPALVLHLLFILGYYTSFIPPVPLAVKKIGVYYEVEKRDNKYIGKYLPHEWKLWSKGSQDFLAREGDKVTVLLAIFSPSSFQDKIYLRWWRKDPKLGWNLEDTIPLTILGGRADGYRGFGTKQYFTDGMWKVIVETSDGREVGRILIDITRDQSTTERAFLSDVY